MTPPVTAPTHPPPPTESTTTTRPQQQPKPTPAPPPTPPPPPPPPPPSGAESEVPPKKRKLEEAGFQRSPYYTIRETVANLRGRFLQAGGGVSLSGQVDQPCLCVFQCQYVVCQGTDSEKKDAAVEIMNEMKDVIELSKKTRLDLSAAAEPVKPFDKHAARGPEDKRAEKVLSEEKSLRPPTSLAANFVHSTGGRVPLKPDYSDTTAHALQVKTKEQTGPSKVTGSKQQGRLPEGSYVIGGSPSGWNFLMWPGSKAIYYGLTKAEWLARQSAK